MQTLSKGYKLPETGDFGDVWFPALEDNIQQLNDHDHDGINSTVINTENMVALTASVLIGDFIAQGGGLFRATVTVPNGKLYDSFVVTVKDPTTKDIVYLQQEKVTSTTYYLYTYKQQAHTVYYTI